MTFPAHADPKPWQFGWGSEHFKDQDFQPYSHDAKTPHTARWQTDGWDPSDWADDRGSYAGVLADFYRGGIITDRSMDDGIPVLEVGEAFFTLSDQDKRRVAMFVDHLFGITRHKENGLFRIVDQRHAQIIGVFTRHGLQLQ